VIFFSPLQANARTVPREDHDRFQIIINHLNIQVRNSLDQWFPKRAVPKGPLKKGPSERVLRLFTIEVNTDQTLGNWYHFMKPVRRIKNLLTVK
jgi:hypothetical protein